MAILEVKNLHKYYGDVKAVNGIDLQVHEGTCFGLLGPNGAGKSTSIEIIEGIKEPTSGEILFRGEARGSSYKEKIGIQFQSTALQDHMTVNEALLTFAKFYPKTLPLDEIIEVCHLSEFLDRDQRRLSGGQRQRVLLALALLNDPELIFLDEPTTGLDPQARQTFWQLVRDIKARNKTIILTTHYMDEAYALCDEIVIVDKGKIIAQGPPRSLLGQHFKGVRITLPYEQGKNLSENFSYKWWQAEDRLEFKTESVEAALKELLSHKVSLEDIEIRAHTLEDLFIDLTGKGLRE